LNTKESGEGIVSAYSRDDFTAPVEDYNFQRMNDVSSLIDQMSKAGGFTATKLAHARDILKISTEKTGKGILNWLSFPACLCATGTRGFFLEAIKRKAFNVIITTCGTLDHDIARTYQDYFHGDFSLDDIALGEEGLNRLGNVIVPNECYGDILEKRVLPWLDEIEKERIEENPENPWLGFGSVELCWAMGDRIEDETSLLYWVAKHRIPMVIPGLSDGSIGAQLFMHRQKSPNFMVDFLAD
jgi:deoxyhypusine synthase